MYAVLFLYETFYAYFNIQYKNQPGQFDRLGSKYIISKNCKLYRLASFQIPIPAFTPKLDY